FIGRANRRCRMASVRGRRRLDRPLPRRGVRAGPRFLSHGPPPAGRARRRVRAPRAGAGVAVPRTRVDPVVVGIPRAHARRGRARARRALPRARPPPWPRAVPPATVVERVIGGDPLRLEGERQTVTILFTDLRGSTALADRLTPEETVAAVNAYLRVMARCVLDAGGILDKFTGDGLMATFGALSDPTNGASAAVHAALEMRRRIAVLNSERAAHGEVVVGFGSGIHTGDVILGAIGLPERSQYDAIGDAVNTASRLETLTKEFHVDAVLSRDTADRLGGDGFTLRSLGQATVRGKANPIEIYALT